MFLRFVLPLAACMVALAGCTIDPHPGDPTDAGVPDAAMPVDTGRIVIESATSLALAPGAEASFVARWLDEHDQPVPLRDVSFALEGTPRGSTLVALGGRTDEDGRVQGTVIAGRESTTFRVRVSARGATPAYVDVAVGASGFGRLVVLVEGGEGRDIAQRTVYLHQATTSAVRCSDALTRSEADRSRTTDPDGMVELSTLPGGERFTIVARATSGAGVIVAEGCVPDVVIVAGEQTHATVSLVPRTLGIEGEYEVSIALAGGASPRTAAGRMLAALDEVEETGGGEAVMLLDAVAAELDARGDTDALALLGDLRAAGADAELAGRLEHEGPGPSAVVRGLVEELAARHLTMHVQGRLFVAGSEDGPVASFTRGELALGAEEPVTVDLRSFGVAARVPSAVGWNDATDELELRALRIELPIGSSMLATLDALAAQQGFEDASQLALASADCTPLGSWLAESPDLAGSCDEACVAAACRAVVEAGLAVVQGSATALDELRSRVVLTGSIATEDRDGNLSVDAIRADALGGEWRSADGETSEPVQGTLGGARIPILP